jgi:hypothetical protein
LLLDVLEMLRRVLQAHGVHLRQARLRGGRLRGRWPTGRGSPAATAVADGHALGFDGWLPPSLPWPVALC